MTRLLTEEEAAAKSQRNKAYWYKPGKGFGEDIPGESIKKLQKAIDTLEAHKKKPGQLSDKPKPRQKAPRAIREAVPTEHEEQSKVIAWWAANAPTYGYSPDLLLSIPNGAHLAGDKAMRGFKMHKLKQTGLRVGAPDLFLAVQKYALGGLFLELKRMNWKPPRAGTKAHAKYMVQQSFHEMLQEQNYRVVFCAGHKFAIEMIKHYFLP